MISSARELSMPNVCQHCEQPGNGKCSECHGRGTIERPVQKKLKSVLGVKTETVGCTSCNNPSFPGRPRGDGRCFFCKGKGYI